MNYSFIVLLDIIESVCITGNKTGVGIKARAADINVGEAWKWERIYCDGYMVGRSSWVEMIHVYCARIIIPMNL